MEERKAEDRADFIAYCFEEYKEAEHLNGRDTISLWSRYHIIDYLKSCYDALHALGNEAISADINALISGMQKTEGCNVH